jgi:dUTP pyrophosphatase
MKILVKKINPNAILPQYMTDGASGCDVSASIETALTLAPLKRVLIPTGLSFEIPKGLEIQVRPRSGLALKKGLTVLNTPGTIDSDYRGELKIILINLGEETVVIEPGERIAQIVCQKVEQVQFEEVVLLSETQRSFGGFGSTGSSGASR